MNATILRQRLKWVSAWIACAAVCHGLEARASTPKTLADSFQSAVEKTETVGIDMELINQAEEKYKQGIAAVLPQISAVGQLQEQEVPSSGTGAAISPGSEPLARLTGTQTLFQGGVIPGLSQLKKLREAAQQNEQFNRIGIFTSVAANFYGILSLEKAMADYTSEVNSYKDWIKALQQRVAIGRSQVTDVLTVEATLASLYAQIELARGQLNVARELYTYLTGLPQDTPLVDEKPAERQLDAVEYYVNGVEKRPDVRSDVLQLQASDDALSVVRLLRLPSMNVTADYYLHRFGLSSDVKWDVLFLVSIPLYTGGSIDSQVRAAASVQHQQDLALSQARRQADESIRAAYQTCVADKSQVEALAKAKKANDLNVKAEIRNYKLGLVTNLDVLNALVSFQQSEIQLDQAIFTRKLDYESLLNVSALNPLIGPPGEVTTSGGPFSFPVF